jgi:hypothetical protein
MNIKMQYPWKKLTFIMLQSTLGGTPLELLMRVQFTSSTIGQTFGIFV